jgi:phage baseplate assembly protein W
MAKKALGLKIPFRLGQDGYFETNTDTISQVSSNIRNLLLTKPGERRFNNAFGSSLYKVLFDQNELGEMLPMLVNLIQNDVNRFMNGIIVEDVKVQLLENDVVNNNYNKIFIKVAFSYKELQSTTEVIITNNNI